MRRIQSSRDRITSRTAASSNWRGTDGPLHVSRGPRKNPLYHAFVEAGRQAGYQVTDDYNGKQQEGFGPFEQTVWRGRRWSAANAYLKPALRRFNVRMVSGLAERVAIENGRAVGVDVRQGDAVTRIKARHEVILSASSINSPKLLMLSGIGPSDHLQEHGLEVIADRPGVGANLQDHLEVYFQMKSKKPITLYRYWNLISKGMIGTQWMFSGTGLGSSNNFESCGFIRSRAGIEYPDIQFHFLPLAVRYDGKASAEGHGFQAHVGPMRAKSRGSITLKSTDPAAAPAIRFNYMSEDVDWQEFRTAIRLTREIFAQPAFAEYADRAIQPTDDATSDDAIDDFVREHAESAYHPCGTCRMGSADDRMAVVDPDCRVIGVDRLRVADSSIFPQITNGNLNAPSIMTGEKAADHILGRKLPADEAMPWIHPDWANSQR